MKNKILYNIAYYTHIIISILFWLYFLMYVFFYRTLPNIYKYIFILLIGIYLGYTIAIWAVKYLKKNVQNHNV